MTTANSEERKKKASGEKKKEKDLKYEEKIWQNAHNES